MKMKEKLINLQKNLKSYKVECSICLANQIWLPVLFCQSLLLILLMCESLDLNSPILIWMICAVENNRRVSFLALLISRLLQSDLSCCYLTLCLVDQSDLRLSQVIHLTFQGLLKCRRLWLLKWFPRRYFNRNFIRFLRQVLQLRA